MLAIITGASSGLGCAFARELDAMGYDTVLCARRKTRLSALQAEMKNTCHIFCADLADPKSCTALFEAFPQADILINNAGLGKFGGMQETCLTDDLSVLNVNITALTILTKLYFQAFLQQKHGYILNVASAAAFMPGPYFALYYASKAFVLRLTQSVAREAKGTGVTVSAFCPGSVETDFNTVAGTSSSSKPISAEKAVRYALKKMFRKKIIIIPTLKIRIARIAAKILPENILAEFSYIIQRRR